MTNLEKIRLIESLNFTVLSQNLADGLTTMCNSCKHTLHRPFSKWSTTTKCPNCEKEEKLKFLSSLGFAPIDTNKLGTDMEVRCCNHNHKFVRSFFSFKNGITKCPICEKEEKLKFLSSLGFTPVTSDELGMTMELLCIQGHRFKRTFVNVTKGADKCPICEKEEKLKFLSSLGFAPVNSDKLSNDLEVKCSIGHSFKRAYRNFQLGVHHCPICEKEEKLKFLNSLGFTPISENLADYLKVKCIEGHEFNRLFSDIKRGVDNCPICYPNTSSQELHMLEFLNSLGVKVEHSNWNVITPKELDFYIPSHNLAIEYNGVFWHVENQFGRINNLSASKGQKFHYNKYVQCKDKGIQLISFDSIEWLQKTDIVKSMLNNKLGTVSHKYHARKLSIGLISSSKSLEFLHNNHIQGSVNASIRIGLFDGDNLVSLMCFNKHSSGFELTRFVSLLNSIVIGGASKLFKHFVNNYLGDDQNIISFSDNRWFMGDLYQTLGFEKVYDVPPSYEYIHKNNQTVKFHKSNFMKSRIKKKYPDTYDETKTEYENMLIHGYDRIWDCGKIKWIYSLQL